jgi:putative ABC transport system permease protein
MLLRLAIRNLLRNTRRTLLSLVAVVAGTAVLVLGQGFIGGLDENAIRASVDTTTGHVLIRPADYPIEGIQNPIDQLLRVDDALASKLDAEAVAWTRRTLFSANAVHEADALRVRGIAFDPARDEAVFPRTAWKLQGAVPAKADDGVLLTPGVARLLRVGPGDRITLQARTHPGALNGSSVVVAGVVTTGSGALDQNAVFVPWDFAESFLRLDGQTSHVAVRIGSRNEAQAFAAGLPLPKGAEVTTWVEETAGALRIQAIRRAALNLLVAGLLGMSAAGIANTVLMAAYERIREIGTLRALGMTEATVLRLFLLEGALMGCAGALLGAAIGGGVVRWYYVRGIDLSGFLEGTATGNMPVSAMLYLQWNPAVVVGSVLFGIFIATAASFYPARVASRMVPAEAVRA